MISQSFELEQQEDDEQVYKPSQERIARICAEIRRDWSEREHRKRSSQLSPRLTVSVVSLCLDSQGYPADYQ